MTTGYLGNSGIILNGTDDAGVRWVWTGGDPWSPSPTVKEVTGDRVNDHGSWDATQYYASRTYALEGTVHAPTHELLHLAKQRFFDACGLSVDLRCVEPGFDRHGLFRRNGEVLWTEKGTRPPLAVFSAPLWAADPRAYSTDEHTMSTGFPSATGGLEWAATWPATWDAIVVGGDMSVFNAGTEISWPVYRIDGPVEDPFILNPATGQAMHIDVSLAAGEWLTVDTGSHQVLANGDTNATRRDRFWGDWWGLQPGNNTVRFAGASAGPGALLTATWRDVWI